MRTSPSLIFFFTSLAAVSSVLAWDPIGHMLTTRIAEEQLTPAAREAVDQALRVFQEKEGPYDFISAACWMDDIRARTRAYNPWHYVNLPFTPEGTPIPDGDEKNPHLVWGLQHSEKVLRGDGSPIEKAEAMVMLLHLAGDVHQPMHTTSNDDSGGNRVEISNLKNPEVDLLFSKGTNLHFFWDSAYRRVFEKDEATVAYAAPPYLPSQPLAGHKAARDLVEKEAAKLMEKYPASILTEQGDAESWALESHRIGHSFAYGKLPKADPDNTHRVDRAYTEKAREIASRQIALAGYRLGALLNEIYDAKE